MLQCNCVFQLLFLSPITKPINKHLFNSHHVSVPSWEQSLEEMNSTQSPFSRSLVWGWEWHQTQKLSGQSSLVQATHVVGPAKKGRFSSAGRIWGKVGGDVPEKIFGLGLPTGVDSGTGEVYSRQRQRCAGQGSCIQALWEPGLYP